MPSKKNLKHRSNLREIFDKVSSVITKAAGSAAASISALLLIVAWAIGGFIFGFSDTWQLIINTATTIITFLMVFVIQQSQNKDAMALQMKLNELIACNTKASNRLIALEDLTEEEIVVIKKFYKKLSNLASQEHDIYSSHSLDEAEKSHYNKFSEYKKERRKK